MYDFLNKNLTNIYLYHSFIIIGELLIVVVLIHMLYKRRTPASMIAWFLSMILLPYISIIFYFIFGLRKRKSRYKKDFIELKQKKDYFIKSNPVSEVLNSHGISEANENEHFELHTDSIKAYKKFMECIRDARNSICISTYVFKYDNTTKEIINALIIKAKNGVKVKILIDSLGSLSLYFFQSKLKKLKDSGVKIEFFMPIFKMPFRNYINLRNHRKIYLFDNKKVLSGGMNLSEEYFGKDNKKRYEDMLFFIEGSSVKSFFNIFKSDWFYASKEKLKYFNDTEQKTGDTTIQVIPSGPDMPSDALYEALLCAIYNAKKRIWIVTPYFIPDISLMQGLIIAKHKGLDIKLITPKKSDHKIVDLTRTSYMKELEEVGIKVDLYNGAMLHAKAILFDESVMLGSVNLDNRSLFLNYEVATFIYSSRVINEVETWMINLLSKSSKGIKKVSGPERIIENIMRIMAPQL